MGCSPKLGFLSFIFENSQSVYSRITQCYLYRTFWRCWRLSSSTTFILDSLYKSIKSSISKVIPKILLKKIKKTSFFFFIWFQEYFIYIESIVHQRWSKTGKTTGPSVSRSWLSIMQPEKGSNHSGEKPDGLKSLKYWNLFIKLYIRSKVLCCHFYSDDSEKVRQKQTSTVLTRFSLYLTIRSNFLPHVTQLWSRTLYITY